MTEIGLPINKLILLYFVEKTGASVSNSQITQFMLEYAYMDYFELQQIIMELCASAYLMKKSQNKRILYYITDEGSTALSFFHNMLPEGVKRNVNAYLTANKRKIQAELDVSANYFPTEKGEYLVKCALIEGNGELLMEVSLVTANKERAKQICENWRSDTGAYYTKITELLFEPKRQEKIEKPPEEGGAENEQ